MAVILNLPVNPESDNIHSSLNVLMDVETVGRVFRCWQLFKICESSGMCSRYNIHQFEFRLNTVGI